MQKHKVDDFIFGTDTRLIQPKEDVILWYAFPATLKIKYKTRAVFSKKYKLWLKIMSLLIRLSHHIKNKI